MFKQTPPLCLTVRIGTSLRNIEILYRSTLKHLHTQQRRHPSPTINIRQCPTLIKSLTSDLGRPFRNNHLFQRGTAVTSPTSRTGGTELRLFHSCDLSVSRPTNRQVQSGPRRIKALRPAGFAARGALAHTPRPFLRPSDQTNYMNLPGAWVKRPGARGGFSPVLFSVMMLRHYFFILHIGPKPPHFSDLVCKNLYHHVKKSARRLRLFHL